MAQADSKQWLESLTRLRKLKAEKIVPGHGPVCGREATERLSSYIRHMRSRVRSLYRKGMSKQETGRVLTPELVEWFPIPATRRGKIEAQIRQGVRRTWDQISKSDSRV
ncbi:MAG TPA: hypothetical protein EYH31_02245 [Anaerolineae bacterium]|nr:hypothetical protein [Anaerolineae bacterium]